VGFSSRSATTGDSKASNAFGSDSSPSNDSAKAAKATLKHSSKRFDKAAQLSDLQDTGTLVLINGDHKITDMPPRTSMDKAWPSVPVASQDIELHPKALAAVVELFAAARKAGTGTFQVNSGFRDHAKQAALYKQIANKSTVQPPGNSEHHTGLAIDIVPILSTPQGATKAPQSSTPQQQSSLHEALDGSSPEERWLAAEAWQHGLILRYPLGAQDITGISFEPWHFRYVGKPHAWYMAQHELTLEEYLQQMRKRGGYDVTIGKRSYSVRYAVPKNGVVYVPSDRRHTLSGDNSGGYIITAWKQMGK